MSRHFALFDKDSWTVIGTASIHGDDTQHPNHFPYVEIDEPNVEIGMVYNPTSKRFLKPVEVGTVTAPEIEPHDDSMIDEPKPKKGWFFSFRKRGDK